MEEKIVKIELTLTELDRLISHLEGLDAFYAAVDKSGSGPISGPIFGLLQKFTRAKAQSQGQEAT